MVRDELGLLVRASSILTSVPTAYDAEVDVIKWTLSEATRLNWYNVSFYSDALVVVREANSAKEPCGLSSWFKLWAIRKMLTENEWSLS